MKINEIIKNIQLKVGTLSGNKDPMKQVENMQQLVYLNPTISRITLTKIEINNSIKRLILSGWIRKQDPAICCLQ